MSSVVAGVRTTILTHEVDVATSRQGTAGLSIGEYCFVGSNARITLKEFVLSHLE